MMTLYTPSRYSITRIISRMTTRATRLALRIKFPRQIFKKIMNYQKDRETT